MDQSINVILNPHQITVDTEDTLERVEAVLDDHNLDYVPVVDVGGAVFGIISMHEIVHFHSHKGNPKAALAWEVCMHRMVAVEFDTPLYDIARLMAAKKIQHVVVMEDGIYRGTISLLDLVEKYLLAEQEERQDAQRTGFAQSPQSHFAPDPR